ncbi:PREDICTED: uncharacterized protein LOC106912007 [Poecilia mexicana]|uniref:uncharacterized protein LOC106912007 n=1 Tax=Poecilia mexicana TaxID=48701 RepID=UPI00072EAAD4|nr:PREDICTED: uncharacterized protein LOC106912007 [Poecilia mexicana]
MDQVLKEKEKDILLMGDFNIDWKLDPEKNVADYVSSKWGLTQIVQDKTKFAKKNSSCIDHIYTNIPDLCSEPKSSVTDCSDHNLITVTVSRNIPKRTRRSNQFDKNTFNKDIQEAQWTGVYEESNPQKALDTFTETFLSVADKHAPLESRDIYDPLRLDEQMETLISERDKEKKKMIKRNHMTDEDQNSSAEEDETEQEDDPEKTFKDKQKKVKDQISKKQKDRYKQQLEETKNDPKQLLKLFEEYLGNSLPFCVINITQDGVMASQTEQMEKLHQIYTGYTDLESVIKGSHVQQIMKSSSGEFNFEKIDVKTVKGLLLYLCDHVIHRIDETEAELMKLAADHISAPIGHILNRCINTAEIPDELKKIKTFPFSGNDYIYSRPDCRNDSVHIMLGYIFDIFLYLQARQFLTANNLVPSLTPQDEMKETETAWLTASKANQTVGAVFLDFSSAFNTISHETLMDKLRTSGFSDSALQLIGNFLSYHEGSSGLPRGSYLAELLFIVFISDIKGDLTKPAVICNSYMMIYAHGDSQTLKTDLYHETTSVCGWVKPFDITFDETRPELIKPRMMPDIFQILDSLSRCHGDKLNWIRALKDIVQQCSVWYNHKIRETLEEYFGKRCLVSVPAKVMKDVINSLRLSRPDLRGF